MTTLLLLSGSQRRDSWNSRLLDHLAFSLQWQCAVDVLQPDGIDLPLFDQDLESDLAMRQALEVLFQRFANCDGIIVACPEYNGQVTPLLKNTVDWVSRLPRLDERFENPFLNKPVLLCSASTGSSGGALVIQNMRALFGYLGAMVIGPSIGISRASDHWSADGFLFEAVKDIQIELALSTLLQWATAQKLAAEPEAVAN